MNVILFDEQENRKNLLPFTFTRPVADIRVGILTIKQKWDTWLNTTCSYSTEDYLSGKFNTVHENNSLYINAGVCPDETLIKTLTAILPGQKFMHQDKLIAYCGSPENIAGSEQIEYTRALVIINNVWDIFQKNGEALIADFELLTKNKISQPLSKTVTVIGNANLIFLEEGAIAEACILNTTSGPIYLGEDSEVMEGSAIRGPFALGEHSAVKLNSKIYGPTTVGPHSKVGGEINNSVIFGFTNKAHDGFLGNSVLGEWCNLGADTNNSNLKNNYGNVKLFNYNQNKSIDTGLQFCGLIMGDYSKSGINTMFNTGTVVGVAANIYGGGFPPTHIPSFSWGGENGFEIYKQEKLFETSEKVFQRRGLTFDEKEKDILNSVFKLTADHRK
ncbi:MAG: glucose-phosphate thymidylyltransferase [Bacteroidetes bacterium]|nr:glucose-phosphate thymidylyltransferase [Bacteroidota bacterium]